MPNIGDFKLILINKWYDSNIFVKNFQREVTQIVVSLYRLVVSFD